MGRRSRRRSGQVEAPIATMAIIDDDMAVLTSMTDLLRSFGFAVRPFACAEDFLASDDAAVDCVITDMQMTGMSGLQLQQALHAGGSRVPLILMTAYPQDQLRQKAKAAGVACFFEKPVDVGLLIDTIRRLTGREV